MVDDCSSFGVVFVVLPRNENVITIKNEIMGPIKFTLIKRLPRNKRFNYTPRYYKGKDSVDESKYGTKIDAFAETYNKNDFAGQWHENRLKNRNRGNSGFNKTILILIAIFVLIFLYIIDFDLSIFYRRN